MLREQTTDLPAEVSRTDAQADQSEDSYGVNPTPPNSVISYDGRMPLKKELEAMPFGERVSALIRCADYHLDKIDRLEHAGQICRLTEWDRRQLASHRASLKRALDRAQEFGIRLSVVEE